MTFDKVKTLRAAEKYLELGKIPAAIKEYTQIVANDAEDFVTINTLGDLHVRVGNAGAAIPCFRRIAEHYREQDFALKAIAVYKKIDRLQPGDTEIATTLADLYAKQDLIVEARSHYLAVANAHQRAGAKREGLDVLRKIADLDPQATDIRLKLADGYLSEGMNEDAGLAFTEAGRQLLARGALDQSLEAFARALEIQPSDPLAIRGLLATHTARGTADEAAEVIERVVATEPDNLELLSMLATAYLEAEDAPKAEHATENLVAKESTEYVRFVDVAHLYLRADSIPDAVRVVARISEQMLAEREEEKLLALIDELLAGDADNVQALRLLVRAHWWQRDMDKLKASLERMADAAQAAGLDADERYALTQLARLAPEQNEVLGRLAELGGAEESAASEVLPEFAAAGESSPSSFDPTTPFVIEHEDYASASTNEAEFQWNTVAEVNEPAFESSNGNALTFESIVAEELPSDSSQSSPHDAESRNASLRARELESVDFYIAQGYFDIAIDTLNLLEQQFGSQPDIEARRRQLNQSSTSPSEQAQAPRSTPYEQAEPLPKNGSKPKPVEPAMSGTGRAKKMEPTPTYRIDPGLAEVFEEYRVFAEKESEHTANGDYETHYNLGLAYKEMDLWEEALEEFQVAVAMVSPEDGTPRFVHCCNLLGHCFLQKGVPKLALKWFSDGLNAPKASEDERQALRFEVASVYEQMGDLNRALTLFTEIYGSNVSYRGVNERLRSLQRRIGEPSNGKHQPAAKATKNRKHRAKPLQHA